MNLGLYTDYYALNYWQESFGFRAVLAASAVYLIGIFFSVIFDIKPRRNIIFKLKRDFRNIDRYGLKPDDDLKDEQNLKDLIEYQGPEEEFKKDAPTKGKRFWNKKAKISLMKDDEKGSKVTIGN